MGGRTVRIKASGVSFDKINPIKPKGESYKTVLRPTMMCGSECWTIDGKME